MAGLAARSPGLPGGSGLGGVAAGADRPVLVGERAVWRTRAQIWVETARCCLGAAGVRTMLTPVTVPSESESAGVVPALTEVNRREL